MSTTSNTPYAPSTGSTAHDAQASAARATTAGQERGSEVLNQVVQKSHDTIDRLAETAAPHVQRIQEGMTSAVDALHTKADHVKDTGQEWTDSLRDTVRENPIAALAVAVAAGVLIARMRL